MLKRIIFFAFAGVMLSACTTNTLMTEDVTITSYPLNAAVLVDGEYVGQTPLNVGMIKSIPHEVMLAKDGYKVSVIILGTTTSNPFIKFGPLVDLDFYTGLTPDNVDAKLTPMLLKDSKGNNPYGDMLGSVMEADALFKAGKISKDEHKYILDSITTFYNTAE